MINIQIALSKQLQQLHITPLDDKFEPVLKPNTGTFFSDNTLREKAFTNSSHGKVYKMAMAHSDICFARRYNKVYGDKCVFDRGLLRLATTMVV